MRYAAERVEDINLSQVRKMFEQASPTAINLALGEPDFDTPGHIIRALKDALDMGYTHYSQNKGEIRLREEICGKLKKDNRIKTTPDEIMVTVGASEALYSSINAMAGPGDDVLIPDPGFLSYREVVKIAQANPVPVKLQAGNNFQMTGDDVERVLTDNTKAVIINSPSNPTGSVMREDEIKAIAELSEEKDFLIISDEIYEKIIYGDTKHYSFQAYTDNAVTINGFSKSYAMTGLRIGYLSAKSEIIEEVLKIHQYNVACVDTPTQIAAAEALSGSQKCVEQMRDEFEKRRNLVVESLNNMGLECIKPDGAFYAFFKVDNPVEFIQKAVDEDVILVNGNAFGDMGEGYIRLSYAQDYDKLKEAMGRLEKIV